MKRYFLLVVLAGLFSCTDQSDCCTNIELGIDVEIQNSSGSDMLNSTTPGNVAVEDVSVFYDINGRHETYSSINKGAVLDNPEGFILQSDGARNFLHVFSNPTVGNSVVTIIKIRGRSDIELVTQVKSNHGKQITNVWLDDQLVWSNATAQRAPHVVVNIE